MSTTTAAHPLEKSPEHSPAEAPSAPGSARLSGVAHAKRRAIVVGASSGIGAALARQLVAEGYQVAALARRGELLAQLREQCAALERSSGGRLFVHTHDVHRVDEVPALFERIARELGGVHLVIYAAGIMPKIGKDEYDTALDVDQIAVNLSGCVAWCNQAAHLFRTQREGTIIGISSIAGDRGRKGNPVYCTTKAAMNTYLEALRNRLSETGSHVCTIKPGYVDTAMTKDLEKLFWLISPEEAARQILASARNRVNVRYVPARWWLVGTIIRSIPSFLFRRLNI